MNVIYVDDEKPAIDNFRLTTAHFPEIKSLHTFQRGEDALTFAEVNSVDVAFLDIEMPGLHGIGLAKALMNHACGVCHSVQPVCSGCLECVCQRIFTEAIHS